MWLGFRRVSTAWDTNWLKAIHNDFLGGLNQKGSGNHVSKARGDISMLQGPITDCNSLWVHGGPCDFRWLHQGPSFLFHTQKRKKESDNWDVPMQLGLSKSSLKPGRNVYRCSHKRIYYNPILAITNWPKKTSQLAFDLGKLGTPWSLSGPECSPCLVSDVLNIEPGFGQTTIFLWWPSVPLRLKSLAGLPWWHSG